MWTINAALRPRYMASNWLLDLLFLSAIRCRHSAWISSRQPEHRPTVCGISRQRRTRLPQWHWEFGIFLPILFEREKPTPSVNSTCFFNCQFFVNLFFLYLCTHSTRANLIKPQNRHVSSKKHFACKNPSFNRHYAILIYHNNKKQKQTIAPHQVCSTKSHASHPEPQPAKLAWWSVQKTLSTNQIQSLTYQPIDISDGGMSVNNSNCNLVNP